MNALMQAHLNGDASAFDRILETYKNDLWGYLVNHVRRRQDAEDLYQEINLKIFNKIGTLRDPGRFRSWVFSIAMNAVRSFYRQKQPISLDQESGEVRLEALISPLATPLGDLERDQQLNLLRQCILKLPERDREILLLDVMAEWPQQQIAEEMELNLNTVKTILRRARIKLARMMAEVCHG